MDLQEDSRKLTLVQENGDFDSENQAEFSSPNHGLQTEDSVMNLYEERPRPVLEHKLDCLLEEDEDADYPPPRLITGLPEPITIDDHTENSKPNSPVISSLKAPCLLFTTEEIKNYIDHLETELNILYQKLKEANRVLIAEQTDNNNRINNLQDILNQQEVELIFYRKFFKTGKNYANDLIPEEYKRLKTPPEAEFRKYSFGRKLKIEMNPKDVDPDIKEAVDGRIQEILDKTQAKATHYDSMCESPRSPSPSRNSFQNIIYINHEFDNFYDELELDEALTPTKSPIYEAPIQLRETDTSTQDHESVSKATFSSENSALSFPTVQFPEPIYELPIQDVHIIREHTTDMKSTHEIKTADQLLQQSKSSQDPHKAVNIQECATGMKFDMSASPSPILKVHTYINLSKKSEFEQNSKESGEDNEINEQTDQYESQLNDLLEIAKSLSTSQDEHNDVPMSQEEERLIEELAKYVGIYDVNLEPPNDAQTESPMFGKIPYMDIGSVQPKLEASKLTDLIAPSIEKHDRKSARKSQVENEKIRRPVKSAYKSSRQQPMLPPIECKKIKQPLVSDFKTRLILPDISRVGPATKSSLHREADTTSLHRTTGIARSSQLNRQDVLPKIRAGNWRLPYYQDVDVSSLPKINTGISKSNTKTSYPTTEKGIVLPKIKSTSAPTVSKQNLRHRINSSILPNMPKPENMPSIHVSGLAKASTSRAGKSQGFTKPIKRPKVLLPIQPNLYQSNRHRERHPSKLPPICNLGLDDTLAARKD